MITSNNVRLPVGERKKLKILTTNDLKRKSFDEEPITRPPTKINGRILQAGRVPDDDSGARTIETIASSGRPPIVLESVAVKKPKGPKKRGPKPGPRPSKKT